MPGKLRKIVRFGNTENSRENDPGITIINGVVLIHNPEGSGSCEGEENTVVTVESPKPLNLLSGGAEAEMETEENKSKNGRFTAMDLS